jgi:hypothetical protein
MSQESWDSRDESTEFDAVAEYPPVSRLAVLSLVLAIFASGAVFSPLLVCVAVAGALVAAAALWSIARAERPPLGRRAAVAALLLCVLFGAWGTTWRITRQQVLYAQAKEHADKWLQLVQAGRLQEAYQLHLNQDSRLAPGADLAEHFKNNRDSRREFESFFQREPLQRIVAAGAEGQVRFVRYEDQVDESYAGQKMDLLTLRYVLEAGPGGRPQTEVFLVQIGRSVAPGGDEARWELRSVETPK